MEAKGVALGRHERTVEEPPPRPGSTWGRRKNTRRWCAGHVGREHNYRFDRRVEYSWFQYDFYTCTKCGKKDMRSIEKEEVPMEPVFDDLSNLVPQTIPLTPEDYDTFTRAIERCPRVMPKLQELLAQPSIWETGAALAQRSDWEADQIQGERRYDQCDGTCTSDCGHCKGQ